MLGAGLHKKDDGGEATAAAPPRHFGHVSWVVSGEDLALLRADNAGLARRYFDSRDTFVVGTRAEQDMVPRGFRSLPALTYTSLRAFERDVHFGAIDPRVAAVVYDPEAWARTPAAERRDPVASMRRFSRLAARWGYGPIVAPGRDLVLAPESGCGKREGEILDQAYLRCGITAGAVGAESFVIQAAPQELELDQMHALLRGSLLQLRKSAPEVGLLSSLSTEPPGAGEQVWPVDLVRAASLELAHSPGIMFNFTPATTEVAASFLRDMEREDPVHGLLVSHRD